MKMQLKVPRWLVNLGYPCGIVGLTLVLLAVVLGLVTFFTHGGAGSVVAELLSLGLALLATGLALLAEGRLASLSDLEYDEKLAMISDYIDFVRNPGTSRFPSIERLRYDITAISHLKRWSSPAKSGELIGKLKELKEAGKSLGSQDSQRIEELVDNLLSAIS